MSVLMRQQDLDTLPDQAPGLTPSGRPTLKALTKRDRLLRWLTTMGSNVIATLKEGFACTPGIHTIDLAVLARLPDTQRLGFVAFGRWTRTAVEHTAWRAPEDALRFLDIGQDVACSVTTTASGNLSTNVKPLDTSRLPGLRDLLDHAQEDNDDATMADLDPTRHPGTVRDEPAHNPYTVRTFAEWHAETATSNPAPPPSTGADAGPPTVLIPGQTVVLPEEAYEGLLLAFDFAGADADLTLLLTGPDGRMADDRDFAFYNQPVGADEAARLLGKQAEGLTAVERAAVHLSVLPPHIRRVVLSVNMDVDTGLTCGALTHARLTANSTAGQSWTFGLCPDPIDQGHGRRRDLPPPRRRQRCVETARTGPRLGRRPRWSCPSARGNCRAVMPWHPHSRGSLHRGVCRSQRRHRWVCPAGRLARRAAHLAALLPRLRPDAGLPPRRHPHRPLDRLRRGVAQHRPARHRPP